MGGVDASKRVIPIEALRKVAEEILEHQPEFLTHDDKVAHLTEHLAGVVDAHCILLQRALCVHCENDVPLEYVEKWGEYLHNGELTCVAGRAREIMGVDAETLHDRENYHAS
jgi:hypothetical protein